MFETSKAKTIIECINEIPPVYNINKKLKMIGICNIKKLIEKMLSFIIPINQSPNQQVLK